MPFYPAIKEFIIEVVDLKVTGREWWYIEGDDSKIYKFHARKGEMPPKLGQMLNVRVSINNKQREIKTFDVVRDELLGEDAE